VKIREGARLAKKKARTELESVESELVEVLSRLRGDVRNLSMRIMWLSEELGFLNYRGDKEYVPPGSESEGGSVGSEEVDAAEVAAEASNLVQEQRGQKANKVMNQMSVLVADGSDKGVGGSRVGGSGVGGSESVGESTQYLYSVEDLIKDWEKKGEFVVQPGMLEWMKGKSLMIDMGSMEGETEVVSAVMVSDSE